MGKKRRQQQKPPAPRPPGVARKAAGAPGKRKAPGAAARGPAPPRRQLSALARTDALEGAATMLLIGEGDFSFAASLARLRGGAVGMLATGLDTRGACEAKYGAAAVAGNIEAVESLGGLVAHGVDCRHLRGSLARQREHVGADAASEGFDAIVFQFPHNGEGEKDEARSVDAHRKLMAAFFAECVVEPPAAGAHPRGGGRPLMGSLESELHVTLKRGKPYDLWRLPELAASATGGRLRLAKAMQFHAGDFEGYAHRRTIGFNVGNHAHSEDVDDGGARRSVTYIFKRTR